MPATAWSPMASRLPLGSLRVQLAAAIVAVTALTLALTFFAVYRATSSDLRHRIDSELRSPDGTPAPFDASLITPYALRHSYAQRHADAGVPVDVLKELMDHVSVTTTMGYYRVSLKRKQQAIRSVGPLATDAAGNPAPFTSPTAYQRASVAVPFGNCTEPSNVKAGGGACPIRFQCAGCGISYAKDRQRSYGAGFPFEPAQEEGARKFRIETMRPIARDADNFERVLLPAEIRERGVSLFEKLCERAERRKKRQRAQCLGDRLKFLIGACGTEFAQNFEIVQQHFAVTFAQNFFEGGPAKSRRQSRGIGERV